MPLCHSQNPLSKCLRLVIEGENFSFLFLWIDIDKVDSHSSPLILAEQPLDCCSWSTSMLRGHTHTQDTQDSPQPRDCVLRPLLAHSPVKKEGLDLCSDGCVWAEAGCGTEEHSLTTLPVSLAQQL